MARRRMAVFTDEGSHLDRFGLLLGLTALSITILMLVDLNESTRTVWSDLGSLAVTIIVGLTLSVAFRASGVSKRLQRIGDVVVAAAVAVVLLTSFVSRIDGMPALFGGKPSVAWAVLAILSPILVLRRVLNHKAVTVQTLAGALAAYLLIAVAFNYAFSAVEDIGYVQFFGSEQPSTSFMYFSLVTITTLGYGDLQPVTSVARYLSTAEALLGQILLVTVVARLVSLYSRTPADNASTAHPATEFHPPPTSPPPTID